MDDYLPAENRYRAAIFGDDVVVYTDDQLRVSQGMMTAWFARYNIGFTNAQKNFGDDRMLRPGEVEFLKRSFSVQDGLFRAPLRLESIANMLDWTSQKYVRDYHVTNQVLECAAVEWAIHGKATFDTYMRKLKDRVSDLMNSPTTSYLMLEHLVLPTWRDALRLRDKCAADGPTYVV
jgi:hypothetical protein